MSNGHPQAYQRLAELLIGSRIAMALRVVAENRTDVTPSLREMILIMNGDGKERTAQEFATLLRSAGLAFETVTPITGSFFSIIEATPA